MKEPKIRFKGFRGEWETKNIASVASLKAGVSIDTSQEISYQIQGYYPCYGGNGLRGYVRDYTHDGIYNIIGRQGALCGNVRIVTGKFHATEHAVVVTPIKKLNPYFLFNVLTKANINQYATGVAQPGLSVQNVNKRLYIHIPNFDEQQSIASYFQHLDSLIQSTTKKIESLKQVKAASLQSMFPQERETTPRVRFKGFEGEWNTPSISEVFELRNGYTPSKAVEAFWEGGTIPWFRMEDIRENGGILNDAIQHISPLGIKGKGVFEKNSIILSTTATIGVHAMLIADSLANQQFTNFSIRKSLKHTFDPMFVYYSFFGIDEWSKKNTNSGGLLSVNIPLLLKQPFLTPSIYEQQKIASYFTTLDRQITLHTQRLEKLKQIKAACLDNMFV